MNLKLKPITYNLKPRDGFTLIEAVVATAVFAFVFSSIVGVYLSAIRLDRKTRAQRAITQNARFILEFLTKEIRNGEIDYARYGGSIPVGNTHLYLINQAGESEDIYLSNVGCPSATPCNLVLSKNSSTSNLNTQTVKLTSFNFYIKPAGDPYAGLAYNEQPRVTITMSLLSQGQTFTDTAKIDLETTVTSRNYPARP